MIFLATIFIVTLNSPIALPDSVTTDDTTKGGHHGIEGRPTSSQNRSGFESVLPFVFGVGFGSRESFYGDALWQDEPTRILLLAHPELQSVFLRELFVSHMTLNEIPVAGPSGADALRFTQLSRMTPFEKMGLEAARYREIHNDPILNRMRLESGFTRKARK